MRIGFTGNRYGMSGHQKNRFLSFLFHLDKKNYFQFHHGDCLGADEDAHNIVNNHIKKNMILANIIIHPPENEKLRAFCKNDELSIKKPKPYLERNQDIVDSSDILIACPNGEETERSGTWSTIRYARKLRRVILIF